MVELQYLLLLEIMHVDGIFTLILSQIKQLSKDNIQILIGRLILQVNTARFLAQLLNLKYSMMYRIIQLGTI